MKIYKRTYTALTVRTLLITLLLCLPISYAAACEATGTGQCYYIDPVSGNNANDGSFATPWRDFSNINTYYQVSYRPTNWVQIGAGDAIYVMNGTHNTIIHSGDSTGPSAGYHTIAYFRFVSGTVDNPIKLKAYPGERPVFTDMQRTQNTTGIHLLLSNYWEVSGIEIYNMTLDCFDVNSDHVTIHSMYIHHCAHMDQGGNPAGIKLTSAYGGTIFNSTFHDTYWSPVPQPNFMRGIAIQMFLGGNHTIYNNTFYQTEVGYKPDGTSQGYADCIMYKHSTAENNTFFHVYNNTFVNCGGFAAFGTGTANTWFHHNLVINSTTAPIAARDFGGPTHQTNQLFEYNTIINSKGINYFPSIQYRNTAFPLDPANVTFRFNIIYDNATAHNRDRGFIDIGNTMDDAVYSASAPTFASNFNCYYAPTPNPKFNIGSYNNDSSNTRPQYGVLGGSYSFTEWKALTVDGAPLNYDQNSIIADPLFVALSTGDYHLQASSPCKRMGKYAIPTGPGDVNGDGIVNIVDINLVTIDLRKGNTMSDANADGFVNLFDLVVVTKYWGTMY
jgi:hypothetical protein